MATKLYPYRAECEKAGVAIYLHARDDKDAGNKLIGHPGYWQAAKKFKTNIKDWDIKKEN
jgi:hypothetical protein